MKKTCVNFAFDSLIQFWRIQQSFPNLQHSNLGDFWTRIENARGTKGKAFSVFNRVVNCFFFTLQRSCIRELLDKMELFLFRDQISTKVWDKSRNPKVSSIIRTCNGVNPLTLNCLKTSHLKKQSVSVGDFTYVSRNISPTHVCLISFLSMHSSLEQTCKSMFILI